jgi:hypothetical protein
LIAVAAQQIKGKSSALPEMGRKRANVLKILNNWKAAHVYA